MCCAANNIAHRFPELSESDLEMKRQTWWSNDKTIIDFDFPEKS